MNKLIGALMCLAMASGASLADAKPHKEKPLPPGLQKKLERTGELPPGWQKKLVAGEVLDMDIYRHGRVLARVGDHGHVTLEVEGRVVRLIEATREIIEVLK